MKRLLVFYAAAAAIGLGQTQPVRGIISGVLTGEDGSVLAGASITLNLVMKSLPKLSQPTTDWTSVTDAAGAFQFVGLPGGNYTLCPRVPNSNWLSPCDWDFPTPTAAITDSAPTANVAITLKLGGAVPVRINDPNQLLANATTTPGAGLLLEVSDAGAGSFFRMVPLVSQDANGVSHQIVVPFNTPLTLFVHPTFFQVSDANGIPLTQGTTTKVPLLVTTGQQAVPLVFTITGLGH